MSRRLLLQIPALCAALTGLSAAKAADKAAADGPPGQQLEEIVVTATKQTSAVDVSTVPISISAYTRRDLEAQGANSIEQIAAMTPGVHFSQQNQFGGSAQTNIEIRGIQSRTGAPTTGIYYEDTPILVSANEFNNGATLMYPVVFDMQRVEVLRGPQGTLFGNSAEGGAVRFIPTPASLTKFSTSAMASLSGTRYGGDPSYEVGLAEGGPLVENRLGFRASAYYRKDGGWIDRCEPLVGQSGCGPTLGHDVNSQQTLALRLAATWAPTDSLTITPDLYYQRAHYNDGGGYEIADSNPAAGDYVFALNLPIPATDQMLIPSLKIEADLGHDVSMTSVTSYVWQNQDFSNSYTEYQDFAFFGTPYPLSPTDYAQADYVTKRNDLYEELRLASGGPADRLTWVAGLFLQAARQADHSRVVHPELPQLIQQNYGQSIEQVLGVGPYLGKYVYWADSPTDDKQVALFGNADVKLTETLKANLGLRYSHFKTTSTLFLAGPFNGGNLSFTGGAASNAVTPKVGLTWQPNASSLYYISAGKGYRAGGVNDQTTSLIPTCHVSAPVDIKPDSLWSYELGLKNFYFDRRVAVDASVYYVTWNNIQNFTDIPQCGIGATLNLGDVVSKGFDLSMEALVTQNLKADLNIAYTDAYFKNTVVVPTGGIGQIVTSGDRVAGASNTSGPPVPPWSISVSGEYDFHPLGQNLYVSLQDLYTSRNNGPFFTHDPANAELYDPTLPTDPSTNLLNLRLGWRMLNGWDVKLFANNVLNAHPQLSVNHALPSDPRLSASTFRPLTIGISGTYSP